MFDWNDEEITNILWGEAGESDDHIVPYPEGRKERHSGLYGDHMKKAQNQEATNAKPAEEKKPLTKTEYTGGKQESSLQYDITEEISAVAGNSIDPWPDLSLSHAAKTDQDSMETEVSNNLTEITKFGSSRGDVTSQLDNRSEIFQSHHEGRVEHDFIDHVWDSIGSFDDLDRILSNNDPIFGHVRLDDADGLWSSFKDVTSTPEKSFPLAMGSPSLHLGALRSTSGHFEVKTENGQDQDHCLTHGYAKMSCLTSHTQRNVHAIADQIEYAGGKSNPVANEKAEVELLGKTLVLNSHLADENITTLNEFTDKVNNQKRIFKSQKKSEGCEGQKLQDSCSTWCPCGNQFHQLDGQTVPPIPQTYATSDLCQKTQLKGSASSQYQHSLNPFVAPTVYGSNKNKYSTMIGLPQIRSTEDNQAVLSAYKVSPSNANPLSRSPGISMKPLTMTPQEKIEKLRWRQQIQALLAIQKQQQQFSHPLSRNHHSVAQKCLHENQIQMFHGGNIEVEENVSILRSIDPNSRIGQDDSDTISMAIDDYYSVEDTILHRLQDIITKLDIRIRLCIRDCLFRLAQSAMLRHYASETSSTNKNSRDDLEFFSKEETSSHNRFTRIPNVETQTNPIDRVVAHLLFHRPLELSGKHTKTQESPALTKLPCERNATGLLSSTRGFLPDNYKSKQNLSYHGSNNPHLFPEGDDSKNSPSIDTSENASHNEAADGGVMEIEVSQ